MARKLFRWLATASACGLCVGFASAQGPSGGPPPGGGEGGPPRFVPPFMQALDVNADGSLDQDEIEMAAESLKTLDKDKDGKLSMAELMPPRGPGGPGGPGGGPGFGGFGGGPGGPGGGPPDLMQSDTNKDGFVSKEEAPEFIQRFFDRWDTNADGKISKEESDEARNRMMRSFGQGGGFGGGPGGGPGGGGPGGGGFDLMASDANKDGFVSKEEAPEFLQRFFDRIDTNTDGKISKEEADEARNRMRRGGPGGDRGERSEERPARPDSA